MGREFEMSMMGELTFFLGLQQAIIKWDFNMPGEVHQRAAEEIQYV